MTKILIADDHEFLRAGLEAVLERKGYEIVGSEPDGEAALAAIEREDPDVVILDVRMPRRGGLETLDALRASGDNRPVILFTVELEDCGLITAMKAKVDGIVFKDWPASRLHEAILTVLAGGRFIDIDLVDRAIARAIDQPERDRLAKLTARERQIFECVALGKRNKEIAEQLGISEGTVKVFLHRIYEKVDVTNRTELASLA
jgi:two-component system, NarL family, nitrate/nitrite response regulator NarL